MRVLFRSQLQRDGGSGPYDVMALTAVEGNDPGNLNRVALAAAGTDYPAEIRSVYISVSDAVWGPNLAEQIGTASCRERVWPYVEISVIVISLKKKKHKHKQYKIKQT